MGYLCAVRNCFLWLKSHILLTQQKSPGLCLSTCTFYKGFQAVLCHAVGGRKFHAGFLPLKGHYHLCAGSAGMVGNTEMKVGKDGAMSITPHTQWNKHKKDKMQHWVTWWRHTWKAKNLFVEKCIGYRMAIKVAIPKKTEKKQNLHQKRYC